MTPAHVRAASALAFSMLRQIATAVRDEGRCSYAEIMPDDPDWCPEGPTFDALQTLGLVDVDIDGAGQGVCSITRRGQAYLWLAGSDAGRALLTAGVAS